MRGAWLLAVVVNLGFVASAVAGRAESRERGEYEGPAYSLPNTQVRSIHSEETGADYQLFIATPADYRTSGKTYPLVVMLDADYSFALTRNIVQHFVERQKLPEMILVAIAYPGAATD